MKLTRRGLLGSSSAAVVGAASPGLADAAVSGVGHHHHHQHGHHHHHRHRRPSGTVDQTLLRGQPNAHGYRPIITGPGEPHRLRTDLGGKPHRGRAGRRKALIAFAQLTDVHIVDAQSPLRVEFTDRLDDPNPTPGTGLFTSAYRPHEFLSGHVADAMVREINRIRSGPVTGKPLALTIQTGDNSDNSQANEVRWNIDLLDGATVRVDSGDLSRYEGVADDDPTYYDPAYYHPDGTPPGKPDDRPRSQLGFPTIPGLLDAARRPFKAAGLHRPWYAAFGNHDGLVQGNFPASTLQLNAIATGSAKLMSLPAGLSPAALVNALQSGALLDIISSLTLTPAVRTVTADPNRRLLSKAEIVAEHFTTTGAPVGHGFTADNRAHGTAYYTFDKGLCRFVVMDTVNPNGYADGSIDQTQLAWLESVLDASKNHLVMVFSHHTSDTMTNRFVATGGDPSPRVLGDTVLATLLAHHNVIAWVNGHTHKNQVWARPRPDGGGGLWEINTASHIDWPSQSRILEVADNRDGTLSIFTTIVDHAGPTSYGGDTSDSLHLAALARELAGNDWQNPGDELRGRLDARNLELLLPAPAFLRRHRHRHSVAAS